MLRLNLRRYEEFCCYLTTLFPKALTTGLYLYGLHGLIFEVCIPLIGGVRGFVIGCMGLALFIQAVVTYFKVISAGPGSPLDFPELCDDGQGAGECQPPEVLVRHSVQVKSNGKLRFCTKCACWKPDRCHHCSTCNRCQLKMDHHCPWFACCVGFKNHKFFIQFLILSVAYCTLIAVCSCYEIYKFFAKEQYKQDIISINLLIVAILSFTLALSVGVFTGMSVYFLLSNITTIENQENVRYRNNMSIIEDSYYRYSSQPTSDELGNVYNLGWRQNWRAVMGNSWLEWVLPVHNLRKTDWYKENGLYFDTDPLVYSKLHRNSELQQQLLEQLNGLQ